MCASICGDSLGGPSSQDARGGEGRSVLQLAAIRSRTPNAHRATRRRSLLSERARRHRPHRPSSCAERATISGGAGSTSLGGWQRCCPGVGEELSGPQADYHRCKRFSPSSDAPSPPLLTPYGCAFVWPAAHLPTQAAARLAQATFAIQREGALLLV